MKNEEIKAIIKQCVAECLQEEGLDKSKWKHLAFAGLLGASALMNPKINQKLGMSHKPSDAPAMSQSSTNKGDEWGDIKKDIEYRDKVAKELGPMSKSVMNQKAFFGGK